MKTWKPDTCECHVEELYDGSTITGMGEVLRKCEAHASVADEDLYGVLYANADSEQKRKNGIYRHLLGYEGTDYGVHDEAEDGTRTLKPGLDYQWEFTGTGASRTLRFQVAGAVLSTENKGSLAEAYTNVEVM